MRLMRSGLGAIGIIAALLMECGAGDARPSQSETGSTRSQTVTESLEAETVIVALGNSLTEGLNVDPQQAYPAQLQRKLRGQGYDVKVINAGIAGETSAGSLARADWILKLQPDVVILETGANDGLRGGDLQTMFENIDRLIARLKSEGVTVVLAGMQIVQNMGQEYAGEFRNVYIRLAEKHGVVLIPFFLEGVAANQQLNQADGIHPTAEGYSVVVKNLLPHIRKVLDEQESPAVGEKAVAPLPSEN